MELKQNILLFLLVFICYWFIYKLLVQESFLELNTATIFQTLISSSLIVVLLNFVVFIALKFKKRKD